MRNRFTLFLCAVVVMLFISACGFNFSFGSNPTPTQVLNTYCSALAKGDYQTAYNLLSSAAQGQTSETQFAASFSNKVTDCTLSNVNNTARIGTISYTYADGSTGVFDYTLVNANGTWAIESENTH